MKQNVAKLLIGLILLGSSNFSFAVTNTTLNGMPSGYAQLGIEQLAKYEHLRQEAFSDYQSAISRQNFIYLAVRLYETLNNQMVEVNPALSFSDTDDLYALKGATVGITSGIGDGKFGPNILLTREQMATMMVKVLELSGIDLKPTSTPFLDDAMISPYAKIPIYKAANYKIINGYNNLVTPKGDAKTEQVLLIYKNMFDAFGSSDGSELSFKSSGEIANYLIKTYPTHTLNGYVVAFDSYKVIEKSDGSLAINATFEKSNLTTYFEAEKAGLRTLADAARARCQEFSKLLGKKVTLSYIYSYYQATNPEAFDTNYLYDEPIFYDYNVYKWGIYYPMLAVWSDKDIYYTWKAAYMFD
jgi:hypothetical protein